MRLFIISNTPHWKDEQGHLYGWGPTVRENETIAGDFESFSVLGVLYPGAPPQSAQRYQTEVDFEGLKPAGGDKWIDKVYLTASLMMYLFKIKAFIARIGSTDVAYLRYPCNVTLLASFLFKWTSGPKRWAKYAGSWVDYSGESSSYLWQKKALLADAETFVTINGHWPDQPKNLLSFLNPCLYQKDIEKAEHQCNDKTITSPLKLLFVGRIEEAKGISHIISILKILLDKKINFKMTWVGDCIDFTDWKKKLHDHGLVEYVDWIGPQSQQQLKALYLESHLFLLPSRNEGWPKVLSEGMAFGCVPIASRCSSIPQVIDRYQCGLCLDPENHEVWATEIIRLSQSPKEWLAFKNASLKAAKDFSYEFMLSELRKRVWPKLGVPNLKAKV